jgi:Spy/CpxP family protein refolding chaperone
MEAMMAKRHADLKAKLKITGEQEGAWTTFTTAMKPPAAMDQKRPDRAEMDKLTTPERIDKMHALRTEHMATMNAAMDKREEATKAFYAALNADQKKVFDAEHARMGDRQGGHRGGHGGQGMGMGK